MNVAVKVKRRWTADEFVATDQHEFGDAWRYELIEGRRAFRTSWSDAASALR